MPHLAEEIFSRLSPDAGLVAEQPWPVADPALLAQQSLTIAVQIMGKLRATIDVAPDAAGDQVIAAAETEPRIAQLLEGKRIVKRIHVPGRIVNFVVAA
jgi:leucyl-tRNA synthetase